MYTAWWCHYLKDQAFGTRPQIFVLRFLGSRRKPMRKFAGISDRNRRSCK